jgi:Leucine-rich repeat (LRR) protein
LTYLHCGYNRYITDVGIVKLSKLTHLDLGNNCLITANGIKMLKNIVTLDIRSNSRIDISILYIKNIRRLPVFTLK